MKSLILAIMAVIALNANSFGEVAMTAKADMVGVAMDKIGSATLTDTQHGVLISADLSGLPPGQHAFHIHAVGKCEPPFQTAGGHYNPTAKKHGIMSAEGMHAGDLPNIYVGPDGRAKVEVLAGQVTLGKGPGTLFDDDGSSLVIHAGTDDYRSDPAGGAGPRIACGVITK